MSLIHRDRTNGLGPSHSADAQPSTTLERSNGASRRDVALGLLGALGGAAFLNGCALESSDDPNDLIDETEQRLSGTATVAWVDTVLGSNRNGDLATKTSSTLSSAQVAVARGAVSPGDGGGGVFVWLSGGTDDGGTIIVPHATAGSGQTGVSGASWHRLYSGFVDVKWFGAQGDGTADDTEAFENTLATGIPVHVPKGVFKLTTTLQIPANTILSGAGEASVILCAHDGEGLLSDAPLNSSTSVNIQLENFRLERAAAHLESQGVPNGGGIVQVGGTFFVCRHVHVYGFRYGVVFDQTELADLLDCRLEGVLESPGTASATEAGAWICNGPSHLSESSPGYTNRITIQRCQFNNVEVGIVDEGGVSHTWRDCNFNGSSVHHTYSAGCSSLRVEDCYSEGSSAPHSVAAITYPIGLRTTPVNVGYGRAVFSGNTITSNGACIAVGGSGFYSLILEANFLYPGGGSAAVTGGASSAEISGHSNRVFVDDSHGTEAQALSAFLASRPSSGVLNHYGWTLENGKWSTRAAAAPSSGTWVQGDLVWTTSPAASGFIGWACVTGGTPGTWKTFGAIST